MSQDLDRLQGTWSITEAEMDGQAAPAAMTNGAITISGNKFVTSGVGAEYKGMLVLDESAKPRRLDLRFTSGMQKGTTNLCIYELKGDRLRLCVATRGDVRPKKFASLPDSGIVLETLRRGAVAPSKGQAAARKAVPVPAGSADALASPAPATEIDGEWPMVSGVMNGAAMQQSMVEWCKRITHGGVTTVMAGPQVMLQAQFQIDAAQSPKAVEYVNLTGSAKGKSQLGIYKLEGNQLTFCIAPVGKPRPGAFDSTKQNGNTLTVWKRG
jgi:uncharacterized protein (TIGR03067 family)